jgi:hypothetical protein
MVLGLSALGAMGCSRYGAYCADAGDCANGNDEDIEACEIALEHDEEEADIWGCTEDWDDYFLCLEERSHCYSSGNHEFYGPEGECNSDAERLHDCIH